MEEYIGRNVCQNKQISMLQKKKQELMDRMNMVLNLLMEKSIIQKRCQKWM